MSASAKKMVTVAESGKIKGRRVGVFIQSLLAGTPLLLAANHIGDAKRSGPQETESYSFIAPYPDSGWKLLGKRLIGYSRPWVGALYMQQTMKSSEKRWLLEVYGRKYLAFFEDLSQKLAAKFEVEVHIRIESEEPKLEYISG